MIVSPQDAVVRRAREQYALEQLQRELSTDQALLREASRRVVAGEDVDAVLEDLGIGYCGVEP